MHASFSFLVLSLFLFAKASALIVNCSEDGEVLFNFVLVEAHAVPRYRLERAFRASDENCAGAVNIIGYDRDGHNHRGYLLVELGANVFQNLPRVHTLNLKGNRFRYSLREMYVGSSEIQTIGFQRNFLSDLDEGMEFPVGVKSLDFSFQGYLGEVKLAFFANHPSLTHLDISVPHFVIETNFEKGIFQSTMTLEKLIMKSVPVHNLRKSLLSNHTASLKYIDMTRWSQLTAVEYNAFFGVSLEELNLSEWPFRSLDAGLFSGASIRSLNLQRSKIEILQTGSFAGLQNSQRIDMFGSKVSTIESGSFRDFYPLDDFELTIPTDISCCKMEGLRELIRVSKGISINKSLQNYTCIMPDETMRVVNISSNGDPAFNLSCCDYQREYYSSQSQLCQVCESQDLCIDSSAYCEGEESNYLSCNKCNTGYAANPFICTECTQSPDCIEASVECSLSSGNVTVLKCNKCAVGLTPNPVSGICENCLQLSPSCLTYDASCIVGTQNLACKICNENTQLIKGICVTVEDASLPTNVILGISVGIIGFIAIISITALLVCLYRRKKKKERKMFKSCGITKNEYNIELHPVEFSEIPEADLNRNSSSDLKHQRNINNGIPIIQHNGSIGLHQGKDTESRLSFFQQNIRSLDVDNNCNTFAELDAQIASADEYKERLQLNTNDDGDTYAELDVQIKSNTYDGDSYAELDVQLS